MGIRRADKKWLVSHMDVLTLKISNGLISCVDLIARDISIDYMCAAMFLQRLRAHAHPLSVSSASSVILFYYNVSHD